jgi:hypothetical protein
MAQLTEWKDFLMFSLTSSSSSSSSYSSSYLPSNPHQRIRGRKFTEFSLVVDPIDQGRIANGLAISKAGSDESFTSGSNFSSSSPLRTSTRGGEFSDDTLRDISNFSGIDIEVVRKLSKSRDDLVATVHSLTGMNFEEFLKVISSY